MRKWILLSSWGCSGMIVGLLVSYMIILVLDVTGTLRTLTLYILIASIVTTLALRILGWRWSSGPNREKGP